MTTMDVNKSPGQFYANGMQKTYDTSITMKFNPDHQKITYTDNSKIALEGLPLKNEFFENNIDVKTPISIKAYLLDSENQKSDEKTYTLNLDNYYTAYKGKTTIDLYNLVKELEKKNSGSIESDKTLVLEMSSTLMQSTELDIKTKIDIGKISEERTFHIATKGDENIAHSYSFTTMGEINAKDPVEVENHKAEYPWTGGMGTLVFTLTGLVLMTAAAYVYSRKRRGSYDD